MLQQRGQASQQSQQLPNPGAQRRGGVTLQGARGLGWAWGRGSKTLLRGLQGRSGEILKPNLPDQFPFHGQRNTGLPPTIPAGSRLLLGWDAGSWIWEVAARPQFSTSRFHFSYQEGA